MEDRSLPRNRRALSRKSRDVISFISNIRKGEFADRFIARRTTCCHGDAYFTIGNSRTTNDEYSEFFRREEGTSEGPIEPRRGADVTSDVLITAPTDFGEKKPCRT